MAGCSLTFPLEGTREDDDDDADDYENMAPSYKDLPPKPGKRTSQRLGEEMCGLEGELGIQGTLAGLCRHMVSFLCIRPMPGTLMVGVLMPLHCPC